MSSAKITTPHIHTHTHKYNNVISITRQTFQSTLFTFRIKCNYNHILRTRVSIKFWTFKTFKSCSQESLSLHERLNPDLKNLSHQKCFKTFRLQSHKLVLLWTFKMFKLWAQEFLLLWMFKHLNFGFNNLSDVGAMLASRLILSNSVRIYLSIYLQ